jgi:hypothetical protein
MMMDRGWRWHRPPPEETLTICNVGGIWREELRGDLRKQLVIEGLNPTSRPPAPILQQSVANDIVRGCLPPAKAMTYQPRRSAPAGGSYCGAELLHFVSVCYE